MDLLRKTAWLGFVAGCLSLGALGVSSQLGCGSSVNISNTGNGGLDPDAASDPEIANTESETADADNLPVLTQPDEAEPIYALDCTGLDGDPATDYITITCAVGDDSLVYLYYCVSGAVTREIEDSEEVPETLESAVTVECINNNGQPSMGEEELVVS